MIHEWVLPGDLSAAGAARDHVSAELQGLALDDRTVDDAVLVASELAANAIRHGAPPVTLIVDITGATVRIEVRDHGRATEPSALPPSSSAGSGRGLALVQQLALDHGWARGHDGTTVWAELPLRERPSP